MPDIDQWIRRRGSRMLFLQGTQDPSTAEFFPTGPWDCHSLWAEGNHHTAEIDALSPDDRAEATAALKRWAGAS